MIAEILAALGGGTLAGLAAKLWIAYGRRQLARALAELGGPSLDKLDATLAKIKAETAAERAARRGR